jgi:hypothetical protein
VVNRVILDNFVGGARVGINGTTAPNNHNTMGVEVMPNMGKARLGAVNRVQGGSSTSLVVGGTCRVNVGLRVNRLVVATAEGTILPMSVDNRTRSLICRTRWPTLINRLGRT